MSGSTVNNSCPFQSINVIKLAGSLKVEATRVGSTTPEPLKFFTGANRYSDFKDFWDFMAQSTPSFSNCKNPLENDPEYLSNTAGHHGHHGHHGHNANNGHPSAGNVVSPISPAYPTNTPNVLPSNTPMSPAYPTNTPNLPSNTPMSPMSPAYPTNVTAPMSHTTHHQKSSSYDLDDNYGDISSSYLYGDLSSGYDDAKYDINSLTNQKSSSSVAYTTITYIVKASLFFAFIFVLLTYIPSVQIKLINKLLICTAITFVYVFIDAILWALAKLKVFSCSKVCGC